MNGWKWLEMAGNGLKWLEMAGNKWKWLEMAGIVREKLEGLEMSKNV